MKSYTIDSRRQFIKKMIGLSVAAGFYSGSNSVAAMINSLANGEMPTRPFGKTGYNIGLFSLGAQGTVEIPGREEDALAIINLALDLGVNYIDTSAYYGRAKEGEYQLPLQGTSERYVGQVLKTRRKETFIATKTHDRSYDGAMRHLEKSLKNLQTDKIDLWQIHNVKSKENEDLAESGIASYSQG